MLSSGCCYMWWCSRERPVTIWLPLQSGVCVWCAWSPPLVLCLVRALACAGEKATGCADGAFKCRWVVSVVAAMSDHPWLPMLGWREVRLCTWQVYGRALAQSCSPLTSHGISNDARWAYSEHGTGVWAGGCLATDRLANGWVLASSCTGVVGMECVCAVGE